MAREIQTYKDEKANDLRSQIEQERGSYATRSDLKGAVDKLDATLKPLLDYVSGQTGRGLGITQSWGVLVVVIVLIVDIGSRFIH